MRMWLKALTAGTCGALLAALLVVFGAPAQACACGAFLLPEDGSVEVSAESAIISWDGRQERILLSLDVDSPSPDAALLIPTPGPATVEVVDGDLLAEVVEIVSPREEVVDLWWPDWLVGRSLVEDAVTFNPPPSLLHVQPGQIEVDVLDAADAASLESWLQENDFVLRDDVAAALIPYIQQGWQFALINLDTNLLSGRLQALDIRFETNQVIYPIRLSVAGGPLTVRTFVFADHRMERADSMGGKLMWAGPVRQTDFRNQVLVDIARDHPFLTYWEQSITDPRRQIDGDMVFAAAGFDAPHEQVYTRVIRHELWGVPTGLALTFLGLIALGFGGGIFSRVSRSRRRRPRT